MQRDINRKKVTKNAYRVTKVREKTALRVRVPGGDISAELLGRVSEIAAKYGNGQLHMTTRQGFEIMGIDWENLDAVNKMVAPLMEGLEINHNGNEKTAGYPAAGTRNIAACIGNKVCPKAQFQTTNLAKRIEKEVYPHDFHFKIAITGCPNDCQKIRMHDFGIMGMCLPEFESERCVSCGRCSKKCQSLATGAIEEKNYKPVRDPHRCIGCGECVLNCPASAWTRNPNKFFRLAIMGRTGKKNPRLAEDWLLWADEEAIVRIIKNTYDYVNQYIDRSLPKEHIGYIVDRTGFEEFKKWALKDVKFPLETKIVHQVYWSGVRYPAMLR